MTGSRKENIFQVTFVISALALFVLIYGCNQNPQQQPFSPPPVAVETITVRPERVENTLSAVGTILSNESVVVKPEVSGKIIKIDFQEGEHVETGRLLFGLDTELLDAEYQEVKANYDFAESQFQRAKNLKKSRVIPDEKYDDIYRAFIQARSRVNTLATRLKKHTISAPFSGVVGQRNVSIGDYITVGEPLVSLEDLSSVKAEFYIPERFLNDIHNGQNVRIKVEALSEQYEGLVYLIDPRINAETRSAVIRARIPNPDESLKPGMFCTVNVILAVRENALMVPPGAVSYRSGQQFIYLSNKGSAEIRPVTTGVYSEERVEITSGLKSGETVVVTGVQKLMPGAALINAKQ
jgi:membrane fusion protein (multidrug efflux system)